LLKQIFEDLNVMEFKPLSFNDCNTLRSEMKRNHYFAGVCFNDGENKESLSYDFVFPAELRDFNFTYISDNWMTSADWDYSRSVIERLKFGNEGGPGAIREGLAYLQNIISTAFIELVSKTDKFDDVRLKRLPSAAFDHDPLLDKHHNFITTTLLLGYLLPAIFIIAVSIKYQFNLHFLTILINLVFSVNR